MSVLLMPFFVHAVSASENLILQYDRPAEFFEETLVIGNGKIGGAIYGQPYSNRISLNDITLWTGEPDNSARVDHSVDLAKVREALENEDYYAANKANKKLQGHYSENYQPIGNLLINIQEKGEVSDYVRTLDISEAIAYDSFNINGKKISREYFASSPDSVIIVKIDSNEKIDFSLNFNSLLPVTVRSENNTLIMDGYAAYHSYPNYYTPADGVTHHYDANRGIHFRTVVKVFSPKGNVKAVGDSLLITGCKEAMIAIVNETSFNGFDKDPVKQGKDYISIVNRVINRINFNRYNDIKDTHIADYKNLFDRVTLNLGKTPPDIKCLPTDIQLRKYTSDNQFNPELEALYFQFGRYLLISSSRTPGVPANLQGLWDEKLLPPWSSNYTTNINLQENYWLAEPANLSELHLVLTDFIRNLSRNGELSAQDYYGVKTGWNLGHNSDIWAMTNPVGLEDGDPAWASWTMGGAWIASHIWEHYMFSQDKEFLKDNYDILRGAAEFCMNWLIPKDGFLMTSPGTSPEHNFVLDSGKKVATSYSPTADIAIIRQCISDAIEAAKELNQDQDFITRAQDVINMLPPYKIGQNGAICEWYHEFKEDEPHHRHQSHLYGLYPGHHINITDNSELTDAAYKTLQLKGMETTGWSTGWRANLYSRMRRPDEAYATYRMLLKYVSPDDYRGPDRVKGGGTYPNLLDAHSPFQIDGNFGGAAAVTEMLMQSMPGKIEILPSLPDAWKSGSVKGLCARGGFVVDVDWDNNKASKIKISSPMGGSTKVSFNGKDIDIKLMPGESIILE